MSERGRRRLSDERCYRRRHSNRESTAASIGSGLRCCCSWQFDSCRESSLHSLVVIRIPSLVVVVGEGGEYNIRLTERHEEKEGWKEETRGSKVMLPADDGEW